MQYNPGLIMTVEASSQIKANCFVGFSGTACTVGKGAIGVTICGADKGQGCDVVTSGSAVVRAGAAVIKEARLASDADGQAVTAEAGNIINAIALESGAKGDLIEVMIVPPIMKEVTG